MTKGAVGRKQKLVVAKSKNCLVTAGVEHEHKLNQMLDDAGIAFWTEEHLRNKGFFKTPDAKLQVCG